MAIEIGKWIGRFRQIVECHAAVAQLAQSVADGHGSICQFVAGIVVGGKAAVGGHAQLADRFGKLVGVFGNRRGVDKRVTIVSQSEGLTLGHHLQKHAGHDDECERADQARFQRREEPAYRRFEGGHLSTRIPCRPGHGVYLPVPNLNRAGA